MESNRIGVEPDNKALGLSNAATVPLACDILILNVQSNSGTNDSNSDSKEALKQEISLSIETCQSPKRFAIGNEVLALLALVPGGSGQSITAVQYKKLLCNDLDRLKFEDIDDIQRDKIVQAVFDGRTELNLKEFECLLREIDLPVGKLKKHTDVKPVSNLCKGSGNVLKHIIYSGLGRLPRYWRLLCSWNGRTLYLALFVLANLALGLDVLLSRMGLMPNTTALEEGAAGGILIDIARSTGMMCNFNPAIILVTTLNTTFTFLRDTWFGPYLPINDLIDFHKFLGAFTFCAGCIHGLAHVINLALWDGWSFNGTLWCGPIEDGFFFCSAVTGILIQILFTAIVFTAHSTVRKKNFNTFWILHHFIPLFYILLLLHARNFWKWFIGPCVCYIVDMYCRSRRKFKAQVVLTCVKPQHVLQIRFTKPTNLKCFPGQFVYLKSTFLSRYEKHPFTLTSCPDDDFLECHIKSLGDWTRSALKAYDPTSIINDGPAYRCPAYDLIVDGPHGAPVQDWIRYESLVFISAGIGVTPFASILKHIERTLKMQQVLREADLNPRSSLLMRVKKVYFHWICRDGGSLSWFSELLKSGLVGVMSDVLEINVYISSVDPLGDIRSVMCHIGLHAHFHRFQADAITGLPVLTQYHRPEWETIFSSLASSHPSEKVGVFFCGPTSMGNQICEACKQFSISSTTEFIFAKENFL